MGLELNLNIKMPGNISETSYGKIQDNQVKINLLDFLTQDETKSISIILVIGIKRLSLQIFLSLLH